VIVFEELVRVGRVADGGLFGDAEHGLCGAKI